MNWLLCTGVCGFGESEESPIGADGVRHNFLSHYTLGKKLGEGGYAVVKLCQRHRDNQVFAVKIGKRESMNSDDVDNLKKEYQLVSILDHPNIMRVFELYEEKKHFYVVMEFIKGGELFDRIAAKKQYSESDARDAAKCVLEGIKYLHSKNIVHRDLKPENLLLASKEDDSSIKIADFGLARRAISETLTDRSGTPNYVSPEMVVGKPYGKPADMWSFGVILYIMLGGYPPFQGSDMKSLFKKIKRADFKFHKKRWSNVSDEAKDLIRNILVVDSSRRYTAEQALQHQWMHPALKEKLSLYDLSSTKTSLEKFNAVRRLRAAVRTVIIANRLRDSLDRSQEDSSKVLIECSEKEEEEGSDELTAAPPSSLSATRAAGLYSIRGPMKVDSDDILKLMEDVDDEDDHDSTKDRGDVKVASGKGDESDGDDNRI